MDWVLIQLRSSSNGSAVASQSAFLKNNGQIVQEDGITQQIMFDVSEGYYFIVVDHRNHLKVMSKDSVQLFSGSATLYDFTTAVNKYYGLDAKLVDSTPTTIYGMYTGDVSNDKKIIVADDITGVRTDNLKDGYYNADLNLDHKVILADDLYYIRLNNLKGSNVP